jgi:Deoxyribonuclease II
MTKFARASGRGLAAVLLLIGTLGMALAQGAPQPLLNAHTPVDWWFVFKFNGATAPGCAQTKTPSCIFGGKPGKYATYNGKTVQWSQQAIVASSKEPTLAPLNGAQGNTCVGDSADDPVGATYSAIYNNPSAFYVVWNDQFYQSPKVPQCGSSNSCGAPWGHSKGIVAWDENGDGVVMQVTTPSWPASGSSKFPRKGDGNTLGCVDDNNVEVSQHFFALKLDKDDLVQVLKALQNASVVTAGPDKLGNAQLIRNGGPQDVQDIVDKLGVQSKSTKATIVTLSSGARLISKPSKLVVPPWQMVSALLNPASGVPLKAATWWMKPAIPTTTAAKKPPCWNASLGIPGPVAIAVSGTWDSKPIGLKGGNSPSFNHAKIGVSVPANDNGPKLSIFGDMNQQGTLAPIVDKKHPKGSCDHSQDMRGGTWYVLDNQQLYDSMKDLLTGAIAPATTE